MVPYRSGILCWCWKNQWTSILNLYTPCPPCRVPSLRGLQKIERVKLSKLSMMISKKYLKKWCLIAWFFSFFFQLFEKKSHKMLSIVLATSGHDINSHHKKVNRILKNAYLTFFNSIWMFESLHIFTLTAHGYVSTITLKNDISVCPGCRWRYTCLK
jgi:hypothetical protein